MQSAPETQRLRIIVSGVVQGVGFRPFVWRLASALGLSGYVRNNNGQVEIEIQGVSNAVESFVKELSTKSPPLARIENIDKIRQDTIETSIDFFIKESNSSQESMKFVPPDVATCEDCLGEMMNAQDRRYRYPFINCTNCGPRFTIISSLPYDRKSTSMSAFEMCEHCQSEYEDPSSRRFHAEPNACWTCGPQLRWECSNTNPDVSANLTIASQLKGEQALHSALRALRRGETIAVKGLGGFHLMLDANSEKSIELLRQKKHRPSKPFAVMMTDLEMVRQYCNTSEQEEQSLIDISRPIVLIKKRPGKELSNNLTAGIGRLGVMLPYTPLQKLLLDDYQKPLIATSANLSEEPIVINNDDARVRLSLLVSGFLDNDRDIYSRYDDSVVQIAAGSLQIMRRSRGIAPTPIKLPFMSHRTVLACGAHLKNTFCLIKKDMAYLSQHIGDLENLESESHFFDSLRRFQKLFDLSYDLIAHDNHPDYLSTNIAHTLAKEVGVQEIIPTQHHHAHIVSCMAENGIDTPVIGIAFDGIGYGDDHSLWGGEFMLVSYSDYRRLASFEEYPLPGSSAAVKHGWRMALSYIIGGEEDSSEFFQPFIESLALRFGSKNVDIVRKQIERKLNAPMTSSCGRLFDGVAALLGLCQEADFEAQAAMELEDLAFTSCEESLIERHRPYPFELLVDEKEPVRVNLKRLIKAIYMDLNNGVTRATIAAKFHRTIACIVREICLMIRKETNNNDVCLSGGVFQNRLLLSLVLSELRQNGFNVFKAKQLPCNDGGISLGQAIIALAKVNGLTYKTPRGEVECV